MTDTPKDPEDFDAEGATEKMARLIQDAKDDVNAFRWAAGAGNPPTQDHVGQAFSDAQGTIEAASFPPDQPWAMCEPREPGYQRKTNIVDLVAPEISINEQRVRIAELLNDGRFELRPMTPDPEQDPDTFTWADAYFQAYAGEDDGELIHITQFNANEFGHSAGYFLT